MQANNEAKKRIFSGIQPSGILTLGNYRRRPSPSTAWWISTP